METEDNVQMDWNTFSSVYHLPLQTAPTLYKVSIFSKSRIVYYSLSQR